MSDQDKICTNVDPSSEYWKSELCKVCYPDNPSRVIGYNRRWKSIMILGGLTGYIMLPIHNHPGSKIITTGIFSD